MHEREREGEREKYRKVSESDGNEKKIYRYIAHAHEFI